MLAKAQRYKSVTDSATENIPPVKRAGDIQQENLRDVFFARFAGKGEKVG